MKNNIRVRTSIFKKLMAIEENRRNWEMLCSSDKPIVPFIGAGISAWCYDTWDALLQDVVQKNFSAECSKIVAEALKCWGDMPDVEQEGFRWMEEIAEYIFDDDETKFGENKDKFSLAKGVENRDANIIFENLHRYLGGYGVNARQGAVKSLYESFSVERMKRAGKIPEYQHFFPRLFPDLLVTTNYDKALERCYPSIFSYSYSDLNKVCDSCGEKESWLYRAIEEKLDQMQARLKGTERAPGMGLPNVPMLLKVHGSIEQASNIALSRARYDEVYKGKMPEIFGKISRRSSLLFMGCGLREDRILDVLKEQKAAEEADDDSFQHFAFCSEPRTPEEMEKRKRHLAEYGIYPIFYNRDVLSELPDDGAADYHGDCLGILLENLLRRKRHYHQPLELLWDNSQFVPLEISGSMKSAARIQSINESAQYVHVEEASQIWELLKSGTECPLIAVTGDTGSGKSTFCQNVQKLNKNPRDAMQFFYIPLEDCKTWNEFCIQIYQSLNIIAPEMEGPQNWLTVAEQVEQRCSGYWRSVLIFDHLDELKDETAYPGQWEAVKEMLNYWKEHQTRVIFTAREYPKGISCYTWHIGPLKSDEAEKVFFSACASRQYENSSLLERSVLNELFSRQTFQPASAYLLGQYADSKNDLATLLEEWESCHAPGDSEEQTLSRLMWNHLLDEHQWADKDAEERQAIEKNILWIWGILGGYPGIFPKAFLECIWPDRSGYQGKALSQKTLIFMKNAGLCEETVDEKYGFLLQNMFRCARRFSSELRSKDTKYEQFDFAENIELNGLEGFRGYTMDKYNGDLREHSLGEWEKKREKAQSRAKTEAGDVMDAAKNILEILEALGEKVKGDEERRRHKDLNLVLHYEIKTVIRFLLAQLSRAADAEKSAGDRLHIAKIGYSFSHYYHYVPSHAFPLVQQLIEIAEKSVKAPRKEDGADNFALYELANLHKVMGDIHRLLGHKETAAVFYATAGRQCDEQILLAFADRDTESYRESLRIKAAVLLAADHYGPDENSETAKAEAIYRQIKDEWGMAYFNQRKGEFLFSEEPPPSKEEQAKRWKRFEDVRKCYNASAEHYGSVEDMTGIAYILKCMGDLTREYRDIFAVAGCVLWEVRKGTAVYYQILDKDDNSLASGERMEASCCDGVYAAARCYAQAFVSYCRHINWRGFANVLQGMGTLLRTYHSEKRKLKGGESKRIEPEEFEKVKALYELAEECYRWLGDMRGLADTLDYAGHGYRERGEAGNEYAALGKWMESEEIWREMGNDFKAKKAAEKAGGLRKKVNHDRKEEAKARKSREGAEQEGVK